MFRVSSSLLNINQTVCTIIEQKGDRGPSSQGTLGNNAYLEKKKKHDVLRQTKMKLEKKKATSYNDLTSLNAKIELIRMNLKTLYVNSLIRSSIS